MQCFYIFLIISTFWVDFSYLFKFYQISHPDQMVTLGDRVYIGARNALLKLDLNLMDVISSKNTTPTQTQRLACLNEGWYSEECNDDIRLLSNPTSTEYIAGTNIRQNETLLSCSTNAYNPMCRFYNLETLEEVYSFSGEGYIPVNRIYQTSHLFTESGDLISYGLKDRYTEDYKISLYPTPLYTEPIQTRIHLSKLWINEANILNMYEFEDFIYIFMRETAVEVSSKIIQNENIYGRVARFCKNDPGSNGYFVSYQKARISCTTQGKSGTIPYHYNELQGTYKIRGAYSNNNGGSISDQIYAVFSAPVNGPQGSAVCVYTFNENNFDLIKAFKGSYIYQKNLFEWDIANQNGDINCNSTPIRTETESKQNIIMRNAIQQANGNAPLFNMNNQKFVKIAVDRVETIVGGITQELMYIAAIDNKQNLLIHKVSYHPEFTSADKSQLINTMHVTTLAENEIINDMFLQTGLNTSNNGILVSTQQGVFKLPIETCYKYGNNKEDCLSRMDPHCVYSCALQLCISIYEANSTNNITNDVLLYNITLSMQLAVCPTRFLHNSTTQNTTTQTITTHSHTIMNYNTTNITSITINNNSITTTTTTTPTTAVNQPTITSNSSTIPLTTVTTVYPGFAKLQTFSFEVFIVSLIFSATLCYLVGALFSILFILLLKRCVFFKGKRHQKKKFTNSNAFNDNKFYRPDLSLIEMGAIQMQPINTNRISTVTTQSQLTAQNASVYRYSPLIQQWGLSPRPINARRSSVPSSSDLTCTGNTSRTMIECSDSGTRPMTPSLFPYPTHAVQNNMDTRGIPRSNSQLLRMRAQSNPMLSYPLNSPIKTIPSPIRKMTNQLNS